MTISRSLLLIAATVCTNLASARPVDGVVGDALSRLKAFVEVDDSERDSRE